MEQLHLKGYLVQSNLDENELLSEDWTEFELFYKEGKFPILVEHNSIKQSDGLAEQEIEAFKEAIGKPGWFDLSKKKVLRHLNQTNFILCNQLPTSDIDDDGYNLNGALMELFVSVCEGMIQCDAEGFYLGNVILVKE